ncbi:MGMT family protein [Neptunomonas antarctica]|uniref:O(6)-alkylguanine repair protein YbaZ n=1 Tax=Neptunomonas antarctica TaxID=619304 RepID=A0A1N7KC28_9GAMM|nr:MGMT family protein [Neptunomonas antarctica]SIS59147.1 O(6)-alkylguanine repair protein YbaZ [Neptunomonas antarctica]
MKQKLESITQPDDAFPTYDEAIWTTVGYIPKGKVATYGYIAALAGFPRTARAVGRALSKLPDNTTIPWFRVINAKGVISFPIGSEKYGCQKQKLLNENIVLYNGKINLKRYHWEI